MNFDFENGLPVWVWGILFLLVVIPFSFRPGSDEGAGLGPNVTQDSILQTGDPGDLLPTLAPLPQATAPVIIEIVPQEADPEIEVEVPEIILIDEDYPAPPEPDPVDLGEGYN